MADNRLVIGISALIAAIVVITIIVMMSKHDDKHQCVALEQAPKDIKRSELIVSEDNKAIYQFAGFVSAKVADKDGKNEKQLFTVLEPESVISNNSTDPTSKASFETNTLQFNCGQLRLKFSTTDPKKKQLTEAELDYNLNGEQKGTCVLANAQGTNCNIFSLLGEKHLSVEANDPTKPQIYSCQDKTTSKEMAQLNLQYLEIESGRAEKSPRDKFITDKLNCKI